MNQYEIPFFQADLMRMLGVRHPNTLRLMIKSGRIPAPDVRITAKTKYWHRSTLVRLGLLQELVPQQSDGRALPESGNARTNGASEKG